MAAGNQYIARVVTHNGSYQKLSATALVATGKLLVLTGNSAATTLLGDDGSTDIPLDKGQQYDLVNVDLSTIQVKGTASDKVVFVGGSWGPAL